MNLEPTCTIGKKVFTAPAGWKFQDREKEFLSMMRVARSGDWTANLLDRDSTADLKDDYISAEPYKRGTWRIVTYDHDYSGHAEHFIRASKRSVAIKEMICLAGYTNVFDEEGSEKADGFLEKCRKKDRIELAKDDLVF